MSDKWKNAMIGLFVLSAFGIIAYILMFLHPYVGDEGQVLRVRFPDIDKVTIGTRVTFAGRPVGEVTKIIPLEDVRLGRTQKDGEIYVYELELAVDSSLHVYNTDKISLRTSGLLGEKSVSIDPEPLKPGQKLREVNNEILFAVDVSTVEDTFDELKEASNKLDLLLDNATEVLNELKKGRTWENLSLTMQNLQEITTALNQKERIEALYASLESTLKNVEDIAQNLHEGQGSLGKLLSTEDLYLRLTALLSKGEIVFNDMNQYGVLFHLDKNWQRMRARRMNLLQKLQTPQQFKNFFNDEIDSIYTSIQRVSSVLEKTSNNPSCYSLLEDKEFQKVFAELLRRTESLEEEVRMYNIQVVEDK
jgi:phospholipid/cholesterol/gamma-HCH transport system substrate-binding protein